MKNQATNDPSKHWCPHCHRDFTCMPPQDQDFIVGCLADDCISYDPARDAEILLCGKEPPRMDH